MDHISLIEAINEKNIENVKLILSTPGIKINGVDNDGMTALQHACFKGSLEIVELLLSMGSDVNSNEHKMGYTALMFAALSGNENIILKLLNAGAKTHRTNSVGRTASQMAAFIGNHRTATIINNYIEKSCITIFSTPNGINKEIRLQPSLVNAVHNLINNINFAPVKVCLTLRSEDLISNWKSICNVLNILCRQNFDPHNTNEGLSIKFHLLSTICSKAGAAYDNGDHTLCKFIQLLLSGSPPNGLAEGQERLLRQGLKEFIFIESQLYRIIVSELHKVPIGHHPTALEILSNKINGQIFFSNPEDKLECSTCSTCNTTNKRCSGCSQVAYCNAECQKMHWPIHKKFCKILKDIKYNENQNQQSEGNNDTKQEEQRPQESKPINVGNSNTAS